MSGHGCGKFQTTPARPQGTFEDLGLPADELSTLKNAQGVLRDLASQWTAVGHDETAALYAAKKLCYDPPNVASGVGISIFYFLAKLRKLKFKRRAAPLIISIRALPSELR
jgi:hypothetical protein